MPEIHVINGRLYTARATGFVVRQDQLALLEASDGVAFVTAAEIGPASHDPTDETGSVTVTTDGRLRVDTKPTDETVNLFAGPSAWGGSPWSSKSPW